MKIYLDDERDPPEGWLLVRTPTSFITLLDYWIEEGKWDEVEAISFDHDLGYFKRNGEEVTGNDCLLHIEKKIIENNLKVPELYIHTSNPSAKNKMLMAVYNLQTAKRQ